jgi:3-methyladenine DNA glycosylase AlkD
VSDQLKALKAKINSLSDKRVAENLQWFFKTGKGEYGEGDQFTGLKVPAQRKLAKEFCDLSLEEIRELLKSPIHEERLISLFILADKYRKANDQLKNKIFNFYIKDRKGINNWDLVDLSAPKIIGSHLREKDKSILFKFALSKNLWDRRIAVLASFEFIKNNNYETSLELCKLLLNDEHDLIHKATGWMLREIGKRNLEIEVKFLKDNYKKMPRTMLRYAIEKFPESKRKKYLQGKI